jgi:hypothetical protein
LFIGKKTDFERGFLFMKNRLFLITLAGILMDRLTLKDTNGKYEIVFNAK